MLRPCSVNLGFEEASLDNKPDMGLVYATVNCLASTVRYYRGMSVAYCGTATPP